MQATSDATQRFVTEIIGAASSTLSPLESGSAGLYQNETGAVTSLSDLVECDFTGYSRQALSFGSARLFPDGRVGRTAVPTFTGSNGSPTSVNICKGAFLTDSAGVLIAWEPFPASEQPPMGGAGTQLPLGVNLAFNPVTNIGNVDQL